MSENGSTGPSQILIIRHGEKLGSADNDDEGGPNLSPRGSARALALPSLFAPATPQTDCALADAEGSVKGTYGKVAIQGNAPRLAMPAFVFATKASHHSNRPIETVSGLTRRLQSAARRQPFRRRLLQSGAGHPDPPEICGADRPGVLASRQDSVACPGAWCLAAAVLARHGFRPGLAAGLFGCEAVANRFAATVALRRFRYLTSPMGAFPARFRRRRDFFVSAEKGFEFKVAEPASAQTIAGAISAAIASRTVGDRR